MKYGQVVNKALDAFATNSRRGEDEAMYEAAHRVATDVERLYWKAEQIKRSMERVMERCQQAGFHKNFENKLYMGVNSLGELQGAGSELDILCAQAERSINDVNILLHRRAEAEKEG